MWRMRILRWITKATDTHSAHVILLDFSRQQWLLERASLLPHTLIASLVYNFFPSVSHLMTTDQQNHLGFSQLPAAAQCINYVYLQHIQMHTSKFTAHVEVYTVTNTPFFITY
jgi:hypothetical protein